MKQKPTFKSILLVASLFSLSAFIFVNWNSNSSLSQIENKAKIVQTQLEDNDEDQSNVPVPDVTVLGRLWDMAQKIILKKN